MDANAFPTKANLMKAKSGEALARQGYELMDRKRNILTRELMQLIDEAKDIQLRIDTLFPEAYAALQKANQQMGISHVSNIAKTIPVDDSVEIKTRSIMGVEIPLVRIGEIDPKGKPLYSFYRTTESLDKARQAFDKVKKLTAELTEIEISAYSLASNIHKTQKRANALKNITIPYYQKLVKDITNALEEKEREDFSRLKVIKRRNAGKAV